MRRLIRCLMRRRKLECFGPTLSGIVMSAARREQKSVALLSSEVALELVCRDMTSVLYFFCQAKALETKAVATLRHVEQQSEKTRKSDAQGSQSETKVPVPTQAPDIGRILESEATQNLLRSHDVDDTLPHATDARSSRSRSRKSKSSAKGKDDANDHEENDLQPW